MNSVLHHTYAFLLLLSLFIGCADDLGFSQPLVQRLRTSGVAVKAVRPSVTGALFSGASKAAWIETDQGILNAVFFGKPSDANGIQITQIQKGERGRYLYQVQERAEPEPKLIDANQPLYFVIHQNMFLETESLKLHGTLKRILQAP